ncbi:MAG TPA: sigma-70 family RNA polymerase sigma factor [Frankiaceae bacterium]|nr:sigma-70 family RNA polymerase sigma factor [Frankiaceae bacterium]
MTVSPLNVPEEPGSFDAFYRRFRPRVHVLVARHFPTCDPDDIAQETMTRCLLNFDSLDPRRDPWPWVSSVARNAAIDSMRRTARIVSTDELPEPPGPADTTYDAVLVNERRRSVRLALARLHPHDRQLIEDHELHGLGYADMAAVRDMTTNALRQRLFRARGRLAVELRRAGTTLGVVPVAFQARAARISRKLHDVAHVGGPAGATALSVAAVAGVTSVATFLGGPATAPVQAALPRNTTDAIEAVTRGDARTSPAAPKVARPVPADSRVTPRSPRPSTAAEARPPQYPIPFFTNKKGDPTDPSQAHRYWVGVEDTPIGPVGMETNEGWSPGYGLLCTVDLAECPEPTGG